MYWSPLRHFFRLCPKVPLRLRLCSREFDVEACTTETLPPIIFSPSSISAGDHARSSPSRLAARASDDEAYACDVCVTDTDEWAKLNWFDGPEDLAGARSWAASPGVRRPAAKWNYRRPRTLSSTAKEKSKKKIARTHNKKTYSFRSLSGRRPSDRAVCSLGRPSLSPRSRGHTRGAVPTRTSPRQKGAVRNWPVRTTGASADFSYFFALSTIAAGRKRIFSAPSLVRRRRVLLSEKIWNIQSREFEGKYIFL